MKSRQAFVANSSSSSFVILSTKDISIDEFVDEKTFKQAESAMADYDLELEEFGYSSIEEAVKKEAQRMVDRKTSTFKDTNINQFYFCSEDFDDDVLYKMFCHQGVFKSSENMKIISTEC